MISISLFNIIGISVIGVMIAFWYAPIQKPKRYLIDLLPSVIRSPIDKVFNCSKCTTFILGLLVYHSITAAALCAITGFILNFIIDYINEWYARD